MSVELKAAVFRSIRGVCPCCGQGKLFKAYLKPVDFCEICTERFNDIETDDAPAWLTILIVGHIIAPLLFVAIMYWAVPDWVLMIVFPCFAAILVFFILPLAKGVFIGMIWQARNNKSE